MLTWNSSSSTDAYPKILRIHTSNTLNLSCSLDTYALQGPKEGGQWAMPGSAEQETATTAETAAVAAVPAENPRETWDFVCCLALEEYS